MTQFKSSLAGALVLSFFLGANCQAAQIPTDPGDYVPLPDGFDLGILYYQHTEHDEFFVDGDEVPAGLELTTDIGLLRWVHYIELGGKAANAQVIFPFGQVSLDSPAGETDASGIGDPFVGGTLWVVNEPETNTFVGLSAFLSLPLGEYDDDQGAVNIGENRLKTIFQVGYITKLSENITLDLVGEYTIFGENDDFSGADRDQDDQYGIQAHLTREFGDKTRGSLSYYHDFGGETSLDGTDQDDEMDNSSWQLTLTHFFKQDFQFIAEYGRSIDVKNGFFEDPRINLRFVKVFP